MFKIFRISIIVSIFILAAAFSVQASEERTVLTREEFDKWPTLPEYTVLNPFPLKGTNCTWFAHGRMMQLGYSKYTLDSMRYHAYSWADSAARGAEVVDKPVVHSIAYWDRYVYFNSRLGHVGVVEMVMDDGSILVSDSSISARPYHTRLINPNDSIWPSAFITIPKNREKSKKFSPGGIVQVTANNLNFRLEGVDETPVLLAKGTTARIEKHVSNGIYSSRPGDVSNYYYWWYAAVDFDGEIKHGWLAESFLEAASNGELIPVPKPEPAPEPDPDPGTEPVPDPGSEPDSEPENSPDSGNGQEPDQNNGQEPDTENPGEPDLETVPDLTMGDINGDGEVDIRDVTMAMQYVLNTRVLSDAQVEAADVNGDGVVDVKDIVLIMRLALRTIVSFED